MYTYIHIVSDRLRFDTKKLFKHQQQRVGCKQQEVVRLVVAREDAKERVEQLVQAEDVGIHEFAELLGLEPLAVRFLSVLPQEPHLHSWLYIPSIGGPCVGT